MASSCDSSLFFTLSRLLLILILFFIHETQTQSCPKSIHFDCPDHAYNKGETSLDFPFTNSSRPECGACVLTCDVDNGHTMIKCMGLEENTEADNSFIALDINPSNQTVVGANPGAVGAQQEEKDPCHLVSHWGFTSTPSVSFTIEESESFIRCPYGVEDPFHGSKHYNICNNGDLVYCPYEQDHLLPYPPPPDCLDIKVPKLSSKETNFTIHYHISDECTNCLAHGGQCRGHDHDDIYCDDSTGPSIPPKDAPGKPKERGKMLKPIIYSVLPGLAIIIFILTIYWQTRKPKGSSIFLSRNEFRRENRNLETMLESYAHLTPKRYTHSDIKKMTNSLKEKLGEGGFGGVYKGKLPDGRHVAVKMLNYSKGHKEGFINEVASIGRTNHVNIVTLLGFCHEGHKRALVYEYMANGSLEKFMHGGTNNGHTLPLEKLFQIVLGIARGLEYLHRGCKTRILHFDIKPHNILLDEEFRPKISDFGLAKLTPQDKQSRISMSGTRGTIGYIAPEVFCRTFGDVSHKSDVYSYGMMVLEVIGSRKRETSQAENSSELYFPQYVYKHLEEGEEAEIEINMNENEKQLKRRMIVVSLWCTQTVPSSRPSMSTVVQMLEGSPESIDIPPLPTFSSPPRLQWDSSTSSITTM